MAVSFWDAETQQALARKRLGLDDTAVLTDVLIEDDKRFVSAAERAQLQQQGQTFKADRYPVDNLSMLNDAIQAWGRAPEGERDALKAYLLRMAKKFNASQDTIDRINALGSGGSSGKRADTWRDSKFRRGLTEGKAAADENGMVTCPTCDGKGTIMEGNRECPTCHGAKKVSKEVAQEAS
jgi:hypothetical protein